MTSPSSWRFVAGPRASSRSARESGSSPRSPSPRERVPSAVARTRPHDPTRPGFASGSWRPASALLFGERAPVCRRPLLIGTGTTARGSSGHWQSQGQARSDLRPRAFAHFHVGSSGTCQRGAWHVPGTVGAIPGGLERRGRAAREDPSRPAVRRIVCQACSSGFAPRRLDPGRRGALSSTTWRNPEKR